MREVGRGVAVLVLGIVAAAGSMVVEPAAVMAVEETVAEVESRVAVALSHGQSALCVGLTSAPVEAEMGVGDPLAMIDDIGLSRAVTVATKRLTVIVFVCRS